MRDFNFFEVYNGKKMNDQQAKLATALTFFVAFLFVFPFVNLFIIHRAEQKVASVSALATASSTNEQKMDIEMKKAKIEELKAKYVQIKQAASEIKIRDNINDFLIYTIRDAMPDDLYFQSIVCEGPKVQIQGVAQNPLAIANFQFNLNNTPYFDVIYIPNITEEIEGYTFEMNFSIKDVIEDEAE